MTANRKIAVVALGLAAAVLAGCSSSDTRNDYVDTVNQIQTDALQAVNQSTAAPPETKADIAEQLDAAEGILANAVAELEEVEVPEEAQAGHPELVAGIEEMRDLFARTAERVRSAGSSAEAFTELTELVAETATVGTEIDAAISQINQDLGAE